MNLRETLLAHQDLNYKAFHSRLVPNVAPEKIIGVRLPVLRNIAKQAFAENAENRRETYEEVMVWGFTLGMKKGTAEEHIADLTAFVPTIDNWAVCDSCCASFKFTKRYRDELLPFLKGYLDGTEYAVRFAVVMLMQYYLTDEYIDEVLGVLAHLDRGEYYIQMAQAWAITEAFIKYRDKTLPLLQAQTLPPAVQNKAIQKCRDSFRVSKEDKKLLSQSKIQSSKF